MDLIKLFHDLYTVFFNIIYVIVGIVIMIKSTKIFYKVIDEITPFDTGEELQKGNLAVGIVIGSSLGGLLISISILIGQCFG